MCARGRAPPGEGPGGAAAGGRRAAPLLPLSGLRGLRRGLSAAGVLARAVYLPAIPRGERGGQDWAPGRGPAAPGAPSFLRLALGFRLVVGGTVAPARSPGAIESGFSGSPCPEAPRLGGRLCPRPRGRLLRRRAWHPPARGSAWSGAPGSAGSAGRARGGWSLPAPRDRRPWPPAPSRRQDSLAPVVMVTAALVNERLRDTRARSARCGPGARRVPGCHKFAAPRGVPCPGRVKYPTETGSPRFGPFLSRTVKLDMKTRKTVEQER